MATFEKLKTKRLLLRSLSLQDASEVQKLCDQKEISDTTIHIPYPYPIEAANGWISKQLLQIKDRECLTYAIVLNDSLQLIGAISIRVNKLQNEGALSYWVGVDYWNKGYCTEAEIGRASCRERV